MSLWHRPFHSGLISMSFCPRGSGTYSKGCELNGSQAGSLTAVWAYAGGAIATQACADQIAVSRAAVQQRPTCAP